MALSEVQRVSGFRNLLGSLIAFLSVCLIVVPHASASGQMSARSSFRRITVRLIDANSGKPRTQKVVTVMGFLSHGQPTGDDKLVFLQNFPVDKGGVAELDIPPTFDILDLANVDACQQNGLIPNKGGDLNPAEIVANGLNTGSTCTSKRSSFHPEEIKAKPGELILFLNKRRWGQF